MPSAARARACAVGDDWLTVRVARRETTAPDGPADGAAGTGSRLPDPATLGYEQARDELASIVGRLESGAGTLEESLALWERGEALAARCQEWLDGARERLTAARGGRPGTQDLQDDDARTAHAPGEDDEEDW